MPEFYTKKVHNYNASLRMRRPVHDEIVYLRDGALIRPAENSDKFDYPEDWLKFEQQQYYGVLPLALLLPFAPDADPDLVAGLQNFLVGQYNNIHAAAQLNLKSSFVADQFGLKFGKDLMGQVIDEVTGSKFELVVLACREYLKEREHYLPTPIDTVDKLVAKQAIDPQNKETFDPQLAHINALQSDKVKVQQDRDKIAKKIGARQVLLDYAVKNPFDFQASEINRRMNENMAYAQKHGDALKVPAEPKGRYREVRETAPNSAASGQTETIIQIEDTRVETNRQIEAPEQLGAGE